MSDADEAHRRDRIAFELTDALYRQSATAIIGVAVGIVVFAAFEWARQPHDLLLPWLGLHFVALGVRTLVTWAYLRQREHGPRRPALWARRFTMALGLSGVLWGVAAVLFFDPEDALGTAFLIIYDGGLVAMVLIVVSSHLPAFLAFTLPTLIPLMVNCFLADSAMHRFTGIAGVVFLVLCVIAARRLNRIFVRSAELRFQNEDLASSLQREKERVEAALLAKSKFLAAASHDLRQPLHALGIFVELLATRLGGTEERTFMDRIQSSSRALESLLNSLLDISRIDAQTLQQRRGHFFLKRLFGQLELEFAGLAEQKGLVLEVRDHGLVAESDPELLGRMVRNLLSNAVRYTAAGRVLLEARREGASVFVSVSDTGPGIAPEEQDRVFEEFYQVGNLERDREKGLGLGLSIVRGLGEVLGHRVRLISRPQRAVGTEFVIEVPAGSAEQVAMTESASALRAPTRSLAGRRVLIIDDERDIRTAMAALLRTWDCEAICVGSADEAIATLERAPQLPDVVVCDYRLPDNVTGTVALVRLEERLGRRMPAVIVTGDTSPEKIREVKMTGRPMLFKPVMPGKLRAVLTSLLAPPAD